MIPATERTKNGEENLRREVRVTIALGRLKESEQRRRQILMEELDGRDAELYDAREAIKGIERKAPCRQSSNSSRLGCCCSVVASLPPISICLLLLLLLPHHHFFSNKHQVLVSAPAPSYHTHPPNACSSSSPSSSSPSSSPTFNLSPREQQAISCKQPIKTHDMMS